MAILKIRKDDDGILRKISRSVDKITPRILTLLDDMRDTLCESNGVGLAAPQVGVLRRVVIIDSEEYGLIELINPEIISSEGCQNEAEGCLSIPGKWGITNRPMTVTVRALDREGNMKEYTGTGLLARAFCHEIDHLNGKLFTDPGTLVRYVTEDELIDDEDKDDIVKSHADIKS